MLDGSHLTVMTAHCQKVKSRYYQSSSLLMGHVYGRACINAVGCSFEVGRTIASQKEWVQILDFLCGVCM